MDNISIFEAWAFAAGFFSYWFWILVSLAFAAVVYYAVINPDVKKYGWTMFSIIFVFFSIALFFAAVLIAPCTIAANTTKEQAARGVYIR